MRKIYTRTGDDGTTGIFGGERVAKDNVRVEANGNLDELNSVIGLIRTMLDKEHKWQTLLKDIQIEIMSMMSITATPEVIQDIDEEIGDYDLSFACISCIR